MRTDRPPRTAEQIAKQQAGVDRYHAERKLKKEAGLLPPRAPNKNKKRTQLAPHRRPMRRKKPKVVEKEEFPPAPKPQAVTADAAPPEIVPEVRRKAAQQVKMMASTNTTQKAMANLLGITIPQLRKEYAKELADGKEFVYAAVSLRLVNAAMGGEFRAMYSWLRQHGGWTDVARREITGKDGGPISFRNLDDNSLAQVLNALKASGNVGRGASRVDSALGIDIDGATDLDAIPGPADESATE